jgi:hypothetical protein
MGDNHLFLFAYVNIGGKVDYFLVFISQVSLFTGKRLLLREEDYYSCFHFADAYVQMGRG